LQPEDFAMDANTGLSPECCYGVWVALLNTPGTHTCKLIPTPTKTHANKLSAA